MIYGPYHNAWFISLFFRIRSVLVRFVPLPSAETRPTPRTARRWAPGQAQVPHIQSAPAKQTCQALARVWPLPFPTVFHPTIDLHLRPPKALVAVSFQTTVESNLMVVVDENEMARRTNFYAIDFCLSLQSLHLLSPKSLMIMQSLPMPTQVKQIV
jgi:hypothetical protein